ncbi:MAG: ABC transporter ATP-binding protein [Gammaproteobacteria bacterium]|nr:ABC transporter ATP-binding protein [Gammaproteobacteria bacterium]
MPETQTKRGGPGSVRATREVWAEFTGLSVRLGGRVVLNDLNATLQGRCIGLLGPNGAGKTTLLNTLLGFFKPSNGQARIFGRDVVRDAAGVRQLIGYMPERDSFVGGMTGVRFVRMMAELSGLPRDDALDRAHEAFFHVGLGEARYRKVETYSQGMKQLAKLAQAIAHGPRLLFLDEPTNGLDPPARSRMLQLVRGIRDTGETRLIVSSHLLRDVEECCDEVLILKDGRIASVCDLESERRSNRKFLFLQVKGDLERFVEGLVALGCEVGMPNRRRLRAVLPGHVEIADLYALAAELSVQIRQLDHKRDSLEDIFLRAMDEPATLQATPS